MFRKYTAAALIAMALTGCVSDMPPKPAPIEPPTAKAPPAPVPPVAPVAPVAPVSPVAPVAPVPLTASKTIFRSVSWSDLPGWQQDNVAEAWPALLASCKALAAQVSWRAACAAASRIQKPSTEIARRYFEAHFAPYQMLTPEGAESGLMTGYYEPLLRGSRARTTRYRYAVYGVPDDLVTVELSDVHPELRNLGLRGRVEGKRVVPYYDRASIERGAARMAGKELVWVEDRIELFFLQIQGSGRVILDSGETVRVGFADHNGRPYRSIGRVLIERGALTADQASMQGIKAWAAAHPREVQALLDSNPRYVFFRELPPSEGGPPGALGVPLTPRRSVAVDARHIPLGAPLYVATTWPNTTRPLNQLMLAQDTGGAIQGALRGDFFWGTGEDAAREAGRMRQQTRMWILLPKGASPPDGR